MLCLFFIYLWFDDLAIWGVCRGEEQLAFLVSSKFRRNDNFSPFTLSPCLNFADMAFQQTFLLSGIWLNNGSHYLITVKTVRCAASTVFAFFMFYFIIFWDVRNVQRETKRGAGFLMFLLRCPWWDSACILATLPQCVHLLECTTVPAQLSSWGVKRSELRQWGRFDLCWSSTDWHFTTKTNKQKTFFKKPKRKTHVVLCVNIWLYGAI